MKRTTLRRWVVLATLLPCMIAPISSMVARASGTHAAKGETALLSWAEALWAGLQKAPGVGGNGRSETLDLITGSSIQQVPAVSIPLTRKSHPSSAALQENSNLEIRVGGWTSAPGKVPGETALVNSVGRELPPGMTSQTLSAVTGSFIWQRPPALASVTSRSRDSSASGAEGTDGLKQGEAPGVDATRDDMFREMLIGRRVSPEGKGLDGTNGSGARKSLEVVRQGDDGQLTRLILEFGGGDPLEWRKTRWYPNGERYDVHSTEENVGGNSGRVVRHAFKACAAPAAAVESNESGGARIGYDHTDLGRWVAHGEQATLPQNVAANKKALGIRARLRAQYGSVSWKGKPLAERRLSVLKGLFSNAHTR